MYIEVSFHHKGRNESTELSRVKIGSFSCHRKADLSVLKYAR